MKNVLLIVLATALFGCEARYPSHLSPAEQLQGIVLQHVISEFLGGATKTAQDDFRLFLSTGDPYSDPPRAVVSYVSTSFRSARPFSAAAPPDREVVERSTRHRGAIIWIAPFTVSGDAPITVQAGYHVGPEHGMTFEYRLQRIKGRWTILDHRITRVA